MAYSYGGQIKFDLSIDFTNKAPLDIRCVVPIEDDLLKIEGVYVGLITYVVNNQCIFVCTSIENNISNWVKMKILEENNNDKYLTWIDLDKLF